MGELEDEILYSKIIAENEIKAFQVRLVVSVFRGVQYLQLRKYFLSYEGEYLPSKEGISMEYTIESSQEFLSGLMEIMSLEENQAAMNQFFTEYEQSKSLSTRSE